MNEENNLSRICEAIENAKQREDEAKAERHKLEAEFISLIGMAENATKSIKQTVPGYTVDLTPRIDRKVDSDLLQRIANENGLSEHLQDLFRWKAELNVKIWKAADESITAPLAAAITTKPGKISVKITRI